MGRAISSVLWAQGPRILIPTFFVGQKVSSLNNPVEIAQTIAFSFLFVSFAIVLFSETPWLSLIPGIAAYAYYSMIRDKENIETYRYSDWILTTPLMLLAILLVNKTSPALTLGIVLADIIMIIAGYLGAKSTKESEKMKFFGIGCIAFIPIIYVLYTMKKAKYAVILTLLLWLLYPTLWYIDEEKIITKDNANISYSVMDVIAKVGLVNLLHI